jgi:hypothetical protein
MRRSLTSAAALLCLSVAAAQAQTPGRSSPTPGNDRGNVERTAPGTPLGTGAARGSDDNATKPVPGPGATTGDSSGGVSGTAPQAPADTSTGSAPPASDMEQAPKAQGHGGSSSSGLGGGAVAPARRSGDNAPAGETGTMSR